MNETAHGDTNPPSLDAPNAEVVAADFEPRTVIEPYPDEDLKVASADAAEALEKERQPPAKESAGVPSVSVHPHVATPHERTEASRAVAAPPFWLEQLPPVTSDLGNQIGPYRIVRRIGSGGFAEVYCAEDTRLIRLVALQVMHRHLADHQGAALRFREGTRNAARLRHPSIVSILDVGETWGGRPYVVMELLDGSPLSEFIARRNSLIPTQIMGILSQLGSALDYVHSQGLVHGDIKPSNVMIDATGHVTLMDFTIAVPYHDSGWPQPTTGTFVGTPGYTAPEQFSGQAIGPPADIYALGVLAYELFTGRRLFDGDTPSILQQQNEEPARFISASGPNVPAAMLAALEHALAKDPSARPRSAAAFLAEARAQSGHSVAVPAPLSPSTGIPPLLTASGAVPPGMGSESFADAAPRGTSVGATTRVSPDAAGIEVLPRSSPQPNRSGPVERVKRDMGGGLPRYFRHIGALFGAPRHDAVDCTVFSPPSVRPGENFLVQVFAHQPDRAEATESLARAFDAETRRLGFKALSIEVARGSALTFDLSMPGMQVDGPVQSLIWRGEPASVQFGVTVNQERRTSTVIGTVIAGLNGVPVAHIKFKVTIDPTVQTDAHFAVEPSGEMVHFYRKAFISYASRDRVEVLKRVQMLADLKIEFFQDVLSLNPGSRWAAELYRHIDESDLFLLFWSHAASESDWVMKEVRYALSRKGGDDSAPPEVVPVIIEGPPPAKPPPDLEHLHFDDRLIYFMAATR